MSDWRKDLARSELVMLEVRRCSREADIAASAGDLDTLTARREEMEVLLRSMEDIRRDQLMRDLRPKPKRRRWWNRKPTEGASHAD